MANDLTINPLKLDAAAATILITQGFEITKVIWNSGTSGVAGDQLVLKDKLGNVILDMTIEASKQTRSENFVPPLTANGLAQTTITHGTAYVYYEGPAPLKTT